MKLKLLHTAISILGFFQTNFLSAAAENPSAVIPTRIASKSCVDLAPARAMYAILVAEDGRRINDRFLLGCLEHESQVVVSRAVLAIGRIGDPASASKLIPLLTHRAVIVRTATAFSLGLLGGNLTNDALAARSKIEENFEVRANLMLAVARTGGQHSIAILKSELVAHKNAVSTAAAAQGLGLLWRNPEASQWPAEPTLIHTLITQSLERDPVGTAAAFAIARYRGPTESLPRDAIASAAQNSATPTARAFLTRALARIPGDETLAILTQHLAVEQHQGTRVEIIRGFTSHVPTSTTPSVVAELAVSTINSALASGFPTIQVEALGVAEAWMFPAFADSVANLLSSTAPWVRTTALGALAHIDVIRARRQAKAWQIDQGLPERIAAARTFGVLNNAPHSEAAELEWLGEAALDSNILLAEAALDGIAALAEIPDGLKEKVRTALLRGDLALTSQAAEIARTRVWKDFSNDMATVYAKFLDTDGLEARLTLLPALGDLGGDKARQVIESALTDPERVVAQAAAQAFKVLTGTDVSSQIPAASRVTTETPPPREILKSLAAKVILHTPRGVIVLRMLPDAPVAVYNFVTLVRSGFYDSTSFHRIVPDFVAQGGDQRGDGWGGPGYVIRDAVSSRSHTRGTVGMASAGKDTAGGQFFINHGSNLHLDASYTLFAEVVSGMGVVDRLEQGDQILRAEVR
jgi:peptidylprolyl isomerase